MRALRWYSSGDSGRRLLIGDTGTLEQNRSNSFAVLKRAGLVLHRRVWHRLGWQ